MGDGRFGLGDVNKTGLMLGYFNLIVSIPPHNTPATTSDCSQLKRSVKYSQSPGPPPNYRKVLIWSLTVATHTILSSNGRNVDNILKLSLAAPQSSERINEGAAVLILFDLSADQWLLSVEIESIENK